MRVLYIDDNFSDADIVRRTLARTTPEIDLTTVASLAECLACLEKSVHYDVLLTDLDLPDGSGLEVLRYIREWRLPLAVVIMTGPGEHDRGGAAFKAGADGYLVREGDYLERLPRTLHSALVRFRMNGTERNSPLSRVLYVGHSRSDIDLMRHHLAQHAPHLHLTAVTSAQDALVLLPVNPDQTADFDIVLVDYCLSGGMDGLEFIRLLREERKLDIPIVLITRQGSEMIAARALHLGVEDYLSRHEGYLFEVPATLEKARWLSELTRERINLKQTNLRLSHLLAASPMVLYNLRFTGNVLQPVWVSENIERLIGYTPGEALAPGWWLSHLYPDDREQVLERQPILLNDGQLTHDYRFYHRDGRIIWILDELRLIRNADGQPHEVVGTWLDISEHKQAELIRQAHQSALNLIVASQPLPVILSDIAKHLETINPDMLVSILLLDKQAKCLKLGAAPSLPDDFNATVDQLAIGEGVGSCGTAAWRGEAVIVSDIDHHPYWQPYLEFTQKADLHACWSVPFKDENESVLGTFAIYHRTVREPTSADLVLVEEFASFTALAVQKVYAAEALRLAATVFESIREGIVVTDLEPRIVAVNRAYTEITGYSAAQVVGKNPKIIRSGRHDKSFYQAMWSSLQEEGYWSGEIWNRRKNGEIYPQWLTISAVSISSASNGRKELCNYVGVFTDISQIKQSEAQLAHLAHYDPLTGLPNRLLVQSRLHHAVERAQRYNLRVATLYIDLDRFKNVNDSLGHPIGDELLIKLTERLKNRLREEDALARLGGDEFLLVMEDVKDPSESAIVAQTLIDLLATPFVLPSGHEIFINASIGISLFPDDASNATELIQHADMAMYQAKKEGRNTYRYHTEALSIAANERLIMENRLRHALAAGEFILHYQPLIDARAGHVIGVEALARWQPPDNTIVPPGKFIPIAEETGLIVPLGEWVLRTACEQGRAWIDTGLPPLVMAVNLSVRQFQSENLVELVQRILEETRLPAVCLELELTESMFMEHAERSIETLNRLKALGIQLAIDDFGTGYSSLTYLKRFPIDKLKIDQSFVRGLAHDPNDREIAATIIAMARGLKLGVLAEGIESEQQLDFLRQQGCDYYQGFLFHRPVPAIELEAWLREHSAPR
ncbi:EAL domain-containing protein [Nitrosomonas europaea]|uniref:EAL domain-containing protein n=1 Tax=Nitrosomonas europaea TaxID=915 RepID=UPI002CF1886D|nr:EAL domain-containing protein [Nitrosomonas europaea]HRN82557.1 EAL domain-containing protein [Nitrosomonas europaea]